MQPYDSSSSVISQDDLSQTVSSSGLFLPSPSIRPFTFGSPHEEELPLSPLPAVSTKLSPMFVDRITRESNLSKPQHGELQKMLAVRPIHFLIYYCALILMVDLAGYFARWWTHTP